SKHAVIVKATNGPRYVVGCRRQLDKSQLKPGTRVALDMTTLTIMRYLPREVDPLVYNMSHEDPGSVSYSEIGGLSEQIRELREVIELPLTNPELFQRVGIIPPKGCLLYGPPGTGKTLLARAVASQLDCNFLKVVSSSIVDKYIGESARLIREMFNYARDHQPCIIFMDEIDAIDQSVAEVNKANQVVFSQASEDHLFISRGCKGAAAMSVRYTAEDAVELILSDVQQDNSDSEEEDGEEYNPEHGIG
ncbi:26S protease regulatory subunit 10B, partial [Characodon lateralis]|nr:26S protease regulatory subunit 10B [Characodon lateralis]